MNTSSGLDVCCFPEGYQKIFSGWRRSVERIPLLPTLGEGRCNGILLVCVGGGRQQAVCCSNNDYGMRRRAPHLLSMRFWVSVAPISVWYEHWRPAEAPCRRQPGTPRPLQNGVVAMFRLASLLDARPSSDNR